jgi:4-amino-4-deoxychorismate lyase
LTISPISLACQPLLAGIKHLNRLEQVLIKQALIQTGYDDAVVSDTKQHIIETSVGNLFWYKDDVWYTPDLSESGVDGVMRNQVLDVMHQNGIKCQVVKHNVSVLFSAQQLFVCNSLMMLVPVVSLFDPIDQQSKNYSVNQTQDIQQYIHHALTIRR